MGVAFDVHWGCLKTLLLFERIMRLALMDGRGMRDLLPLSIVAVIETSSTNQCIMDELTYDYSTSALCATVGLGQVHSG
jgi:hypothetical protein